jgi:hypothetical protein
MAKNTLQIAPKKSNLDESKAQKQLARIVFRSSTGIAKWNHSSHAECVLAAAVVTP